MKRLETSVEEIDYLKEQNKQLSNLGALVIVLAQAYLQHSSYANACQEYHNIIKDFKLLLKQTERGYK